MILTLFGNRLRLVQGKLSRRCFFCHQRSPSLPCDSCFHQLNDSYALPVSYRRVGRMLVFSLYRYDGLLRDLLLQAKVSSNYAAQATVLSLLQRKLAACGVSFFSRSSSACTSKSLEQVEGT